MVGFCHAQVSLKSVTGLANHCDRVPNTGPWKPDLNLVPSCACSLMGETGGLRFEV